MSRIYLDFNASTPLAPEVKKAMRHAMETGHGTPSSTHWAGAPSHADGRRCPRAGRGISGRERPETPRARKPQLRLRRFKRCVTT